MPSRRAFVAASGLALLAGCLQSTPADSDEPSPTDSPTDSPPATGQPTESPSCTSGFLVSADSLSPAADVTVTLSEPQRDLVAQAAGDDAVSVRTYGQEPLHHGSYVAHDDAFYRVELARPDATEVPARKANLDWEQGQTAPDDGRVLSFEDLPTADRRALRLLVDGPRYDGQSDRPAESLTARDVPVPYPDGGDDSALVGEGPTWVRRDGRTYRVAVTTEADTVTRRTFAVSASRIADDEAGFRKHLASAFLVDLSDLPADQRAVVATATEGIYEECAPASEALAALRERLSTVDRLPHPADGWYVAFDGERYRLSVREWVH